MHFEVKKGCISFTFFFISLPRYVLDVFCWHQDIEMFCHCFDILNYSWLFRVKFSPLRSKIVFAFFCFLTLSNYVLNVFFWHLAKPFPLLYLSTLCTACSYSVLRTVEIFHVNQRIAFQLLHCSSHQYTENTHVLFSKPLFFFRRYVGIWINPNCPQPNWVCPPGGR